MLQLHYANRLENLLEPLAHAAEAHQRRDPLDTLSIIVPNRAVEQFVKYGLAERLGVAANLRFPFLRRYLAEIAERADPALRVIEVPHLQVALFECLRSDAIKTDAAFAPVRDYVAAADSTDTAVSELRLFELAGRMAHLFQEYSISRTAMLRAWSSPDAVDRSDEERWQRKLWTVMFDRDGIARAEWTRDSDRRSMLLPYALASIRNDHLHDTLPPVLHVFGLASPGRVFLDIFARLGKLRDLHLYALNPCMEFWEDVDTSAKVRRTTWRHRADRVGSALEEREDPFELAANSDTRALQLWGRPGREYIRMLNELTDCDFHPHFSEPPETSLLSRLQKDILFREIHGNSAQSASSESRPQSIRFQGAPGIRREVEIVANEILRAVSESEASPNPLRFHQIAVIVPDAVVDTYLPHVETVFASRFGIPVETAGHRSSGNRCSEAIDLLLNFPLGRATRDDVLRLLTHPAIAGAGADLDVDRLSAWCEELGVFFGADAADLADTYVPANLFQWDQALTRVALGAFMEGDGDATPYSSEAGDLLPLALSQDELPNAERFLHTARALLADAHAMRSHRMPLSQWALLIAEFIGAYINVSDPADQTIRDQCLEILESMAPLVTDPVGYEVARAFVSSALADLAASHGGFAGRGVAAGSLGTLRALPFRTIFVMGLNEATFPERDRRDPIDLRITRRHPGDISPPERDRYLFLEAILAAREQITFSWVERDAQTGDRLEPSTTLRELHSILRSYSDDAVGVTSHPVNSHDPKYFSDLAPDSADSTIDLVSFNSDARRGARMLALHKHVAHANANRALPGRGELLDRIDPAIRSQLSGTLGLFDLPEKAASKTDDLNLPVAAIRRFLECPLQGAARYALGMVEDDGPPEDATDEPIALTRLNHAVLLRDTFWAARGDPEVFKRAYREAITVAQMKGVAPAGPFAEAALAADCARFARWCEELGPARAELHQWHAIRMGRGDEFSVADRILPSLRLEVCAIGPDGRPIRRNVNLHGSLGAFSPSLDRSLRLVSRKKAKPQDFMELFIAAIVMRAAGEPIPPTFEALVLGDPSGSSSRAAAAWRQTLRTPSIEEARDYLANIVSEMISRPHDYFLPIEAVAVARRALADNKDPLDPIDNIREGFGSCASDYGPVRNAIVYEPPDEREIAGIIERRFGLIEAIFGGQGDA